MSFTEYCQNVLPWFQDYTKQTEKSPDWIIPYINQDKLRNKTKGKYLKWLIILASLGMPESPPREWYCGLFSKDPWDDSSNPYVEKAIQEAGLKCYPFNTSAACQIETRKSDVILQTFKIAIGDHWYKNTYDSYKRKRLIAVSPNKQSFCSEGSNGEEARLYACFTLFEQPLWIKLGSWITEYK